MFSPISDGLNQLRRAEVEKPVTEMTGSHLPKYPLVQPATLRAVRFLRHPSRAKAPRPLAKSGSAAGIGVTAAVKLNEFNPVN
jgi:hypothetical protein